MLTAGSDLSWSPDSRQLVYTVLMFNVVRLFAIDITTVLSLMRMCLGFADAGRAASRPATHRTKRSVFIESGLSRVGAAATKPRHAREGTRGAAFGPTVLFRWNSPTLPGLS